MSKEFKSFYKEVKGNEGGKCHYPTRLDSYGCGCQHDCSYCLAPDTQVLMYDGTLKAIKDVQIGDAVYGVADGGTYRKFTKAVVTNWMASVKKAYKITLTNGNTLICSGDHQWLSNRGWKYTSGAMSGANQRPYLTTKNKLMGFNTLFNIEPYSVTDDYKRGYLRGVILGDANLKSYSDTREGRESSIQYHFRLALKNTKITGRVNQYLADFGVLTSSFSFPMIDRKTKEEYVVPAIRTASKENYDKIQDIITTVDSSEFKRGYLAGLYDAEGYDDILIRRVYNSDETLIKDFTDALTAFGFNYTYDKDTATKNKIVKTVRLLGGVSENLRFGIVTGCLVGNEEGVLTNLALKSFKSDNLKITNIEELDEQELIDITTTTRNFIANGVVSHNCYAKSLLDFRNLWDFQNPSVADINKIRNKIKKLPEGMPAIRLGGMTDCFQPLELEHRVTYETIKALNEKNQPYLIVTKSDIVGYDEYIELMKPELAHIQVTITCFDDDLYHKLAYEKACPPSQRIKAVEKLYDKGFDVQVRLSPFIPEFVDFDKLANIRCDKLLVEFLRVNTWIKKWFNIDFSPYIIHHSGYNHLPLEVKQKWISKIHGFKEITVCEDEDEAYKYWNSQFNPNPNDCCNLRV